MLARLFELLLTWVFDAIGRICISSEVRDLKNLEKEPSLRTRLKKLKKDKVELDATMKNFCAENPDHWLCQPDAFTDKSKGTLIVHKEPEMNNSIKN